MWWVGEDFAGSADLRRLAEYFRPSRDYATPGLPREVIGVGSVKLDGIRKLLVTLHEALLHPRSRTSRGLSQVFSRPAGTRPRPFGLRFPPNAKDTLFEWSDLNEVGRYLLRGLDLPSDTSFMFVEWPSPAHARVFPGAEILVGEESGTTGLLLLPDRRNVRDLWPRVFATTAGHVVGKDTVGSPNRYDVEQQTRWRGKRFKIGHVLGVEDPTDQAGPDIALFELLASAFLNKGWRHDWPPFPPGYYLPDGSCLRHMDIARFADAPVPEQSIGTLLGARSGKRRGWVDNPQLAIRSSKDKDRHWLNCWTMFEIAGGFAQPGDSGGLVRAEDGTIVGQLVGSMGVVCRGGRRQAGLVQDIHTALGPAANWIGRDYTPLVPRPLPHDEPWLSRVRNYFSG